MWIENRFRVVEDQEHLLRIGVVLVASLAMFRPLVDIVNAGMTLPRPFCRRKLSVMVEIQGSGESRTQVVINTNVHLFVARLRFDQSAKETTATAAVEDGD